MGSRNKVAEGRFALHSIVFMALSALSAFCYQEMIWSIIQVISNTPCISTNAHTSVGFLWKLPQIHSAFLFKPEFLIRLDLQTQKPAERC